MRIRTIALATGAAAVVLVLAACTQANNNMGNMPGMDHGGMMNNSSSSSDSKANMADQMFVTMMIPHHQQAIEMSDLVLGKSGVNQGVRDLAQKIKDAQGPEIATMKGWLTSWGMPYNDSMSGHDMGGMGDGMMSGDDMAALESANGPEASRLFLEQMIVHHQGAIEMAQSELKDGQAPEVLALAQAVVDAQTAEIAAMKQMLTSL